jgi:glycosyltransferase involved in cell wall biosynthesis
LRVLLISPYPPTRDGIGTYAAFFRGELSAQGYEVRVVAARGPEQTEPEVLGSLRGPGRKAEPVLLGAITEFAPDLVHVQFAVAAYAGAVFAVLRLMRELRERGYPVVATLHEVTRDTASLRAAGRLLYRAIVARTDLVIVHTEVARDCLYSIARQRELKVEVIRHPHASLPEADTSADELRLRFGLADVRVVLAFGFIDVDKGLQDLTRAVGLLAASPSTQDVKLVIAGSVRRRYGLFRIFELRDRAYLGYLRQIVKRDGLTPAVLFAGYVPQGSVKAWFDLATVAVLAYRRSEQSGVANLARSAGTPLVTTAAGELSSLSVVPAVPPRNPEALASALNLFLASGPEKRAKDSSTTDLDMIVTQTVAAYAIVLNTSTTAPP